MILLKTQNLGVFEPDHLKIKAALSRPLTRSTLGRFKVLNHETDPKFPASGTMKDIFFCVCQVSHTVFIALRGKEGEGIEMFQNEKRIITQLQGVSGICSYLFCGGYMVMKLFNRGDLIDVLNRNELKSWAKDWIGLRIAQTLSECHDRGVVLRDLKPDNILIAARSDGSCEARLTDFGLAIHLDGASEADLYKSCGSPHYAPPENLMGHPLAHYSGDLWSFAVTLYVLETVEPPYDIEKSDIDLLRNIQIPDCSYSKEMKDCFRLDREQRPTSASIARRMYDIFMEKHYATPFAETMRQQETVFNEVEKQEFPEKPAKIILSYLMAGKVDQYFSFILKRNTLKAASTLV